MTSQANGTSGQNRQTIKAFGLQAERLTIIFVASFSAASVLIGSLLTLAAYAISVIFVRSGAGHSYPGDWAWGVAWVLALSIMLMPISLMIAIPSAVLLNALAGKFPRIDVLLGFLLVILILGNLLDVSFEGGLPRFWDSVTSRPIPVVLAAIALITYWLAGRFAMRCQLAWEARSATPPP